MVFKVYDKKTEEPVSQKTIQGIAKNGNLISCDIEGFAITEDGALILCDECGNYTYCPTGMFLVKVFDDYNNELYRFEH